MARIVEAPPATGETVDISFTQPSPAPSARTSKRTLQPIPAPRLIAGEWKEDAEHARDLCRHPPPIGTVHTSGCAAATPGAIPARPIVHFPARCGNACSPNAKMLEKPELGNSWPPISAKGATRAASAELPHRCSPAVLMLLSTGSIEGAVTPLQIVRRSALGPNKRAFCCRMPAHAGYQ